MLHPNDDAQLLESVRLKLDVSSDLSTRPCRSRETRCWALPGFAGKSRVTTSFGNLPIEALRLRDPVKTSSGEFLEVKWIDKLQLDAKFMSLHPEANPILIPRGSFGRMSPDCDVMVSPAQQLRMPRHSSDMSATSAQSIVGRGQVARKPQNGFTYYLFHCGEPASVSIEGLWFDVTPE